MTERYFWMKLSEILVLLLHVLIWLVLASSGNCQRPTVVNIGAVFTVDSVIGRASKPSIEAAVSDVNDDPRILNGTQLRLIMKDSVCNVFMGSLAAFQVIEKEVTAIIGPISSSIAHTMSDIANGLKVPLISFAATDPTLSALQFPYFLRTTPSDSHQMAAMADLIDFYGWKEVISVYMDNEHGRNGIAALDEELYKKQAKLSEKLALPVNFDENTVTGLLKKSKSFGPRVYVVHLGPDPRLRIFHIAQKLEMMTTGYVWFATDWLSVTLDSFSAIDEVPLKMIEGVIGFHQHVPESSRKEEFRHRWRKMQEHGSVHTNVNAYGFYAYDTVWAVAYAINEFLNDKNNVTFSYDNKLLSAQATKMQLEKIKVFDGGDLLLTKILQVNFTGLTGQVKFGSESNIMNADYDVVNINRTGVHTIGYWSNDFGFSVLPPETRRETKKSFSYADQKLGNVTWPGGDYRKPRGWVIADIERPLRIAVPKRISFVEFVSEQSNKTHVIQGYCIDIFKASLQFVPYEVPYRFELFGDGLKNPNYDQLVKMVADDVFDAAVGDIAIVTNRTRIVDFSQPFVTTGLVVVAPVNNPKSNAWIFLKPFSVRMWSVVAMSFAMIAVVIWFLEHRVNDDFRGPPKRQLATMFLFSFSTLFKKNQEATISSLARLVMIVWLFVLMIITSSYTANLTSILTVQQLSSPISGIDSLVTSNVPIGYQGGSFTYEYLSHSLGIAKSRLVALSSPEDYERALRLGPRNYGGVAAIVDEIPFADTFLAERKDFGIVGQPFTRSGWGFAFKRDSPLAVDMSTAILKLSETGKLREIRRKWFCKMDCPGERRSKLKPNQLQVQSFKGLYLVCGAISLVAFLVFLVRMIRQFVRYKQRLMSYSSRAASSASARMGSRWTEVMFNFFDFVDEKEEAIKKMFTGCDNVQPQVSS